MAYILVRRAEAGVTRAEPSGLSPDRGDDAVAGVRQW